LYWRDEIDTTEQAAAEVREIYRAVTDTPDCYDHDPEGTHPPLDYEPYRSTRLRHPKEPLVYMPHTITEITGPRLGPGQVQPARERFATDALLARSGSLGLPTVTPASSSLRCSAPTVETLPRSFQG
jgi:hypothetical protein